MDEEKLNELNKMVNKHLMRLAHCEKCNNYDPISETCPIWESIYIYTNKKGQPKCCGFVTKKKENDI